jgi:malic enzyme
VQETKVKTTSCKCYTFREWFLRNDVRLREELVTTANSENSYKQGIARNSNPRKLVGNSEEVIRKADIFIGVPGKAGLSDEDMVQIMNHNVF